jgi:hypothetical protein
LREGQGRVVVRTFIFQSLIGEKAPLSYKAPDEALEDVEVDPKRKLFLISANDKPPNP